MTRIAYRALGLLACAVMFASLIAARPLQLQPSAATPQSGHKQLQLPAYASAQVAQSTTAKTRPRPATQLRQVQLRAGLQSDVPMQARRATTSQAIRPARIAGDGPQMRGQLVGQTERLDF